MQTIQLRTALNSVSDDGAAPPGETWIDIDLADDEGRRWLASQSGVDEAVVRRLLEPALATYWRRFSQGLHFHAHSAVPGGDSSTISIIDFGVWLEPNRIITVRQGNVPALAKAAEACSIGAGPSSSWELILSVLSEGLSLLGHVLHDLTLAIDQLEDEVLSLDGDAPIHRIGELQRRLVFARRFRMPLTNMVSFISSQPGLAIEGAVRDELEGTGDLVEQQQELLGLLIERAEALQGQIRDQLADSMNRATYRFTWVATVFLPLSFLTGLLGINVAGIPGDHDPLAFWLVCGVLCVIATTWGIMVGRVTSPSGRRSGSRDT
jgi:zinc transporter